MLKIGWKSCPYCDDDEVYRSRSEPLDMAGSSAWAPPLQLVGAIAANSVTTVQSSFPHLNILTRSAPGRDALRLMLITKNGNARHSRAEHKRELRCPTRSTCSRGEQVTRRGGTKWSRERRLPRSCSHIAHRSLRIHNIGAEKQLVGCPTDKASRLVITFEA